MMIKVFYQELTKAKLAGKGRPQQIPPKGLQPVR